MKKKNKKKNVQVTTAENDDKAVRKANFKLLAKVAGAALLSSLIYFAAMLSEKLWMPVIIAYIAAATIVIIAYFIINKGFTENELTEEMLSDDMSHEEKLAFIEHAAERKKKTAWMLILFIALITPLMIDLARLFVFDGLLEKLG